MESRNLGREISGYDIAASGDLGSRNRGIRYPEIPKSEIAELRNLNSRDRAIMGSRNREQPWYRRLRDMESRSCESWHRAIGTSGDHRIAHPRTRGCSMSRFQIPRIPGLRFRRSAMPEPTISQLRDATLSESAIPRCRDPAVPWPRKSRTCEFAIAD